MGTINISIDLNSIPKDLIKFVTKKDGSKGAYISLYVSEKREIDQFNNTHYVAVSIPKDQKDKYPSAIYLGNGKLFNYAPAPAATPEPINNSNNSDFDDLPF